MINQIITAALASTLLAVTTTMTANTQTISHGGRKDLADFQSLFGA